MVSTSGNSSTDRACGLKLRPVLSRYTWAMPAAPADLSINARWIVPMTARDLLLEDAFAMVRDGRIIDVLPRAEARRRMRATVTVERPAHLVMPGLVNAYATRMRSDTPRDCRCAGRSSPGRRFAAIRLTASDRIAGMLKSGITCFGDSVFPRARRREPRPQQGMRAVIGLPVAAAASPWAEGCAEYLSPRPRAARRIPGTSAASRPRFAPLAAAVERRRRCPLGTLADELDAGMLLAVHASQAEVERVAQRHGGARSHASSALDCSTPALNAIHMRMLDDADIDRAQRAGIAVTLCPQSNLRRAAGRRRSPSGAAVADCASGLGQRRRHERCDQDLWSEIEAAGAARARRPSAWLPPWDALAAARAAAPPRSGSRPRSARSRPGKWADLCCVDLGGPATAPLTIRSTQLVFAGAVTW